MEPNRRIARAHTGIACAYLALMLLFVWFWASDDFKPSPIFIYPTAVTATLCLVHALLARGARAAKPWARIVSLAIALPMLLAFPIGTMVGVYLIAYAAKPWVADAADRTQGDAAVTGAG